MPRPEDWHWSSFQYYAAGLKGSIEIESQWTAFWRGNQLPEGMQMKQGEAEASPRPLIAKCAMNGAQRTALRCTPG